MSATGIHKHPIFKLGRGRVRRDPRNLKLKHILRRVTVPDEYDFDLAHPGIPLPMFGNDVYGDCVIAARAHMTLRFEDMEQDGLILPISTRVCVNEYFRESGGQDSGLIILDSLGLWRKKGWTIHSHRYRIAAYAEIYRSNHDEAKAAIVANTGIQLGLDLPISAQAQIQSGKPWDVVAGPSGAVGSWGGHCVTVPGYTVDGPVCVTWGRKQQMTWRFFDNYCSEAYSIIDALDKFRKPTSAIDAAGVEQFLSSL